MKTIERAEKRYRVCEHGFGYSIREVSRHTKAKTARRARRQGQWVEAFWPGCGWTEMDELAGDR